MFVVYVSIEISTSNDYTSTSRHKRRQRMFKMHMVFARWRSNVDGNRTTTTAAMEPEKLIDFVKQYEVLYDTSNSKYMDSLYKNRIWNKIGDMMGYDGPSCKMRWTNLKDTYKKALRRNAYKSRLNRPIRAYKYAQQLEFLRPHISEEQTMIEVFNDIEDDNKMRQISQDPLSIFTQYADSDSMPSPVQQSRSPIIQQTPPSPPSPRSPQSPPSPTPTENIKPYIVASYKPMKKSIEKKIEIVASTSNDFSYALNGSNNQRGDAVTTQQHPVESFLLGAVAPTLKCLNSYDLTLAKGEIFAIVQKYEMKMAINDGNNCTN